MNKNTVHAICLLCLTLAAALGATLSAEAQATVTFTSPTMTIDQGTSLVDFFGQIDNTQAGAVSITPAFINISGTVPLIMTYGSFDNPNNLPATVGAGAVSSAIDFFSVDTSSLAPGAYSGVMVLTDSNSVSLTNPANFSITVVPTPEPGAFTVLGVGATGLCLLRLRTRRRRMS